MYNDLRYAIRQLRKNPGFTAVAVLTLALGIGANTAIFSLVDAVLLRPLPFREPDRLVMIWEDASRIGFPQNNPAPGNYSDWKSQNRVFEDVAAVSWRTFNLTGDGQPERINANTITANFFPLLGIRPALGRYFLPEDDRPDSQKVAILGYGLWQRRFGGDPGIVGREILLDGAKFTVVGVLPLNFQFLGKDLWVPIAFSPRELARRDNHYLAVVARLGEGITVQQAQVDIEAITSRIAQEHPTDAFNLRAYVLPLREQFAGEVRLALIVLLVAVACIVLIACANLANLMLSRAVTRTREVAVRSALGASRGRVMRQLLTESVLLAVLGGTAGLIVASWSFTILKQLVPENMALLTQIRLDTRVFAYGLLLSVMTGIIFGLAPAFQAARLNLTETLRSGSGQAGFSRGHRKLRSGLVVSEVALALVLLIGAGLLIQSFVRLRHLDLGFRPDKILTLATSLPRNKYGELPKRVTFYEQVLERVKALPGVRYAAFTTAVPLTWKGGTSGFSMEGRLHRPGQDANHRQISPEYFHTLQIPLLEGRLFEEHDGPDSMPVTIINQTMARQFWPGESALGKRFKLGAPDDSDRPWIAIVGIVGDVRQMGLQVPVKAEMYFPYQQMSYNSSFAPGQLAIRTVGDPRGLAASVQQQVWAVDPDQPVSNVRLMEDIVESESSQQRLGMSMLGALAALALLLASVGIYGVLAYLVTQRTPEIGIRMALGAQPVQVLLFVMGDGLRLVLLGLGVGLIAALGLTRLMSGLLFQVRGTDPTTLVAVSLVLMVVSLLACYLPARRAAKVDPMVALRYE
jgi:predicted permease